MPMVLKADAHDARVAGQFAPARVGDAGAGSERVAAAEGCIAGDWPRG